MVKNTALLHEAWFFLFLFFRHFPAVLPLCSSVCCSDGELKQPRNRAPRCRADALDWGKKYKAPQCCFVMTVWAVPHRFCRALRKLCVFLSSSWPPPVALCSAGVGGGFAVVFSTGSGGGRGGEGGGHISNPRPMQALRCFFDLRACSSECHVARLIIRVYSKHGCRLIG